MTNDAQIDEAAIAGYRAADGARIPKRFAEDPLLSDAWHVGRSRAKEADIQRDKALCSVGSCTATCSHC